MKTSTQIGQNLDGDVEIVQTTIMSWGEFRQFATELWGRHAGKMHDQFTDVLPPVENEADK